MFKSGVDLVGLNVIVTDADQKFVRGLSDNSFAIYEDGVQQELSYFAATSVPIDLALLLDTSASMSDKLGPLVCERERETVTWPRARTRRL